MLYPMLNSKQLNNSYIYGIENLRGFNKTLGQRKAGRDFFSRMAIIGQSFVQTSDRWIEPFTKLMQAEFGNSGGGFIGFASRNGIDSGIDGCVLTGYTVTRTGTWTDSYRTGGSISMSASHCTSSTVGDKITIVTPADTPIISTLNFMAVGHTASSSIRFRINRGAGFSTIGAWSSSSTFSSGSNTFKKSERVVSASLTPATTFSGAVQIEIEVVSGTCNLIGVYLSPSAVAGNYGLIVNKLGCSGARVDNFSTISATEYRAGLTELNIDLAVCMFGGNDAVKDSGVLPSEFQTNIETFIDTIQGAETAKKIDIMFVAPAQNYRTVWQTGDPVTSDYNIANLSEYANSALAACKNKKCAFVNLQPFFGEQFTDYSFTSTINPLYESDGIHPASNTGGALIAYLMYEILTKSLLLV